MSDDFHQELTRRFMAAARGRSVVVMLEPEDFILACDYQVSFDADKSTFHVAFRRGGHFEGAYRCVERFIEASSEAMDGVTSTPESYIDVRRSMMYWVLEQRYEQWRSDLEAAISGRITWLEQASPGKGEPGRITIEARAGSLRGFLSYLLEVDAQVRRAVIGPEARTILTAIVGVDPFSSARPESG